tara:strand:- start:219 stop:446 length:228 start_codon:yes stop_codon:yes gene_type:complete
MFKRNIVSVATLLSVLVLSACGTCVLEEDIVDTDLEEAIEGTTEGSTEETEEPKDTGVDTAVTDPEDTAVDTDTE